MPKDLYPHHWGVDNRAQRAWWRQQPWDPQPTPCPADITVICPWEAFNHLELHELAQYGII